MLFKTFIPYFLLWHAKDILKFFDLISNSYRNNFQSIPDGEKKKSRNGLSLFLVVFNIELSALLYVIYYDLFLTFSVFFPPH